MYRELVHVNVHVLVLVEEHEGHPLQQSCRETTMHILVCVKQIQSTYARTGKTPEAHFLDPQDSIFRVNPYDEAAVALAVRLKAATPETLVTVVTLAPMLAEEDLWRVIGLGADRLCRIDPAQDPAAALALDSRAKAQVLARAAQTLQPDLILCGKESMDRGNGLVAACMAALLQLPLVSATVDLQAFSSDRVRVARNAGRGRREILDCRLPALLSVELPTGPPPLPAYAAVRDAQRKEIIHMVQDCGGQIAWTHGLDRQAPRPRPKPVEAPDSLLPGFERVKRLLSGSTVSKQGKMVSGPAAHQVDEIVAFLQQHGFLPQAGGQRK